MLYFLRVGADKTKGGGGFWSTVFDDRTCVFCPIPDSKVNKEKALKYKDYSWFGKSLVDCLSNDVYNSIKNKFIHNDPEFETCTYGSPKFNSKKSLEKNYNALSNMHEGDLLAFYAAFLSSNIDRDTELSGYYVFSYFWIDSTFRYDDVKNISSKERNKIKNNMHFIHRKTDQIIVKGNISKSCVFSKPLLLCLRSKDVKGSAYYPNVDFQKILGGYKKALNLSSIRKFESEKIKNCFLKYVAKNGGTNLLVSG